MAPAVIVLVLFAGLFAYMGGLKAIAKVNVFQMILLIGVSTTHYLRITESWRYLEHVSSSTSRFLDIDSSCQ
jgi:Na+(H+)/acetate symporter ActP